MSRTVRRVPADWVHPTDETGRKLPLIGEPISKYLADWDKHKAKWDEGFIEARGGWEPRSNSQEAMACGSFEEWWDERPRQEDFMPEFPNGTATHFQMYEETSDGTPISPVCATIEELARWLADNRASAVAGMPATYEEWLAMCRANCSVGSIAVVDGKALSGVAAVSEADRRGIR